MLLYCNGTIIGTSKCTETQNTNSRKSDYYYHDTRGREVAVHSRYLNSFRLYCCKC